MIWLLACACAGLLGLLLLFAVSQSSFMRHKALTPPLRLSFFDSFGCASEQQDFDALVANLEAAGVGRLKWWSLDDSVSLVRLEASRR